MRSGSLTWGLGGPVVKVARTLTLAAATCCGIGLSSAAAQQPVPPVNYYPVANSNPSVPALDDLQARLEQQQRDIQNLQAQLTGLQANQSNNGQVQATPVSMESAAAVAAPCPDGGTVVGDNMSVKVDYRNGGSFLYFATPDNSFTMHLGGWTQWDNVWWDQSNALKSTQGARSGPANGVASGANQGGINNPPNATSSGDLQDGEFFRRIRLVMEGTFWEQGIYRFNWAFENDQLDTNGLDEFWFGAQNLPVAQEVRLGHFK